MNIIDIQIPLITNLLKKHGIEISVDEKFKPDFFPNVEKFEGDNQLTLKYHRNEETLLTLYNAVSLYCTESYMSVIHYMLFYAFLERHDYDNATNQLELFRNEISNNYIQRDEDCLSLQMLFTLLHEMYHILFHHSPDLKDEAIKLIRKIIKELKDEMSDFWATIDDDTQNRMKNELEEHIDTMIPKSLLLNAQKTMAAEIRANAETNRLMPSDYERVINDADGELSEELACDMYAWFFIMQELKNQNADEQEIIDANKLVFVALTSMQFNTWVLNKTFRPNAIHNAYNGKEIVIRQSVFKSHLRHYNMESKAVRTDYKQITFQLEKMFSETLVQLLSNNYLSDIHKKRGNIDKDKDKLLKDKMDEIINAIV